MSSISIPVIRVNKIKKDMKDLEGKCLRFVLHFYKKNKLDTQKALKEFKSKHNISEPRGSVSYHWWLMSGVAAIVIGFLLYSKNTTKEAWRTITAEAYPVTYMLPDSSSVIIYPNSFIRFHNRNNWVSGRNVQMRGKVSFNVIHNETSPFVVEGLMAKVKVLGTRFIVDESRKDTTIVNVESGKVQFSAIGQSESLILTKGMTAQLISQEDKPKIISQLKTGSFVFDNTPLVKVLDELSSYYKVTLSANKTDKRLTASFKEKSLDEIIRFIEKALNVKIEKQNK